MECVNEGLHAVDDGRPTGRALHMLAGASRKQSRETLPGYSNRRIAQCLARAWVGGQRPGMGPLWAAREERPLGAEREQMYTPDGAAFTYGLRMSSGDLTPRQAELVQAFLAAWSASGHVPFELNSSAAFSHPSWPTGVRAPDSDEVRALVHRDLLTVDKRAVPTWRFFPSEAARELFEPGADETRAELSDADRRLGRILDAVVAAFETDPSEPLHLAVMDQLTVVEHAGWGLPPDVVREHDIAQLVDLGLVGTQPRGDDLGFWPTPAGRIAVKNPAAYLDQLADGAGGDTEKSRLRAWADRLRVGDITRSTAAGTASGLLIKVLTGAV